MPDEPCDRETVALEKLSTGHAEPFLTLEEHLGDGDGVETQAVGAERELFVQSGAGSMNLHDCANDVPRIHGPDSKLRQLPCGSREDTFP